MILDSTNLFSDKQAITASAASTNVISTSSTDIGKGVSIPLLVQVTTTFATLTSLTVAVQTDTDEAFGTAVTLTSQTIAVADLVAGKRFGFNVLPEGLKKYIRIYYTVTGSNATAGKITAGIPLGIGQRY